MKIYKRKSFILVKTEDGPDYDCDECCFFIDYQCEAPGYKGFGCTLNSEVGYHWREEKTLDKPKRIL